MWCPLTKHNHENNIAQKRQGVQSREPPTHLHNHAMAGASVRFNVWIVGRAILDLVRYLTQAPVKMCILHATPTWSLYFNWLSAESRRHQHVIHERIYLLFAGPMICDTTYNVQPWTKIKRNADTYVLCFMKMMNHVRTTNWFSPPPTATGQLYHSPTGDFFSFFKSLAWWLFWFWSPCWQRDQ